MKKIKIILAIFALVCTTSCGAYYRMITVLDKNGNVQREIYAHGKTDETTGDFIKNPFLFEPDADWNMHKFDSVISHDFFGEKKELNIKITKNATSIKQFTQDIIGHNNNRMLAVPDERLQIRRGWLFTRYSLKVVYPKLEYTPPISVEHYLNKEEQMLWSQGKLNSYSLMNGSEMCDYLNNIKGKFIKWYGRNLFETCLMCIKKYPVKYDLDGDKEKIYRQVLEWMDNDITKIDPGFVCDVLDSYYKTRFFSKLYTANDVALNDEFDHAVAIEAQIPDVISYELKLPGTLIYTNAPIIEGHTLIWKVDGMRLLFDDYTLTAETRITNRWAFWVTGFLLLGVICCIITLFKKKII